MTKSRKKLLGVALALGSLLFMGVLSQFKGPDRDQLVQQDFETVQGVFMGLVWFRGQDYVVLGQPSGLKRIILDKSVTFRPSQIPPIGASVMIAVSGGEEAPRLVRADDIQRIDDLGQLDANLAGPLLKDQPDLPWKVSRGHAYNGGMDFETDLPDGVYRELKSVERDGKVIAIE